MLVLRSYVLLTGALLTAGPALNEGLPWQKLEGSIRSVCWSPPAPGCVNVTRMIWVAKDTDPAKAAEESKAKPEGMAAVFLWDMAQDLLNHPEDRCRTPEGELTQFAGAWLDNGVAELRRRALEFFQAYKAAGGRLDFLVLDYEGGLSNWHLEADNIRAIGSDPRSRELKEELGFDDVEKVINWRQGTEYLTWNAVMGRRVCEALNRGLFDPVRQLYPRVKASNYGAVIMTHENAVPDLNGHLQYSLAYCGTHGSRAFYGGIGQLAQCKLAGDTPYGNSPFAVLRWELNGMRAIRRSSDVPFQAWVSHKNFAESAFRDNDYYQELIYHLALSGTQDFLFWNPDRWRDDQDPSQFRTDAHDLLFDQCLTVLNGKLGGGERHCVTLAPIPWDSPLIATGMQVGQDKVIWRVTVPPGTTRVRAKQTGEVLVLEGTLGLWYETAPGVELSFEVTE